MPKRSLLKMFTCWTAIASLAQPTTMVIAAAALATATPAAAVAPPVTPAPLTTAQKIALLRQHVKYVFVIFHENESFDHYFGTFPGANGLFSAPAGAKAANQTTSFTQSYLDTNLNLVTQTPFLLPQAVQVGGYNSGGAVVPIYPYDLISVDHAHQGMANDLDVVGGVAQNDHYAMNQETLTTTTPGVAVTSASQIVNSSGIAPSSVSLANKQKAETDLSHIDCDTIPFMWSWAKNFVLFDNFHQTIVGPSTPNAIAIIAGQSGQTQYALHPTTQGPTLSYANNAFQNVRGASYGSHTSQSNAYVPVVGDPGPWPGSNNDTSNVKPPYNADESPSNTSFNLTFATLPLSFMGSNINTIIANDQNPTADLLDVQDDIAAIAGSNLPVNWGWYQQGFDAADSSTVTGYNANLAGANAGYVLHHNAPQYFGYLADNTQVLSTNLKGAKDFITAVNNRTLPAGGGVYYLRGGYNNNDGLSPLLASAAGNRDGSAFIGNDDHPAYADHQISEAFAAKAINAIVNSPYWSQSAIVITYDETDGFYDHAPVSVRNTYVDGSPLAAGPRIPTIVISPWAAAGTISHNYSEHSSLIKLINTIFNLTPLASLPDEQKGATNALSAPISQSAYGPADDPNNSLGNMLEAFDYTRMQNNTPIPGSLATFPPRVISTLPHLALANPNVNPAGYSPNGYTNGACKAIGVMPTDFASWSAYQAGTPSDPYPVDVNPRPSSAGGTPTSGTWKP